MHLHPHKYSHTRVPFYNRAPAGGICAIPACKFVAVGTGCKVVALSPDEEVARADTDGETSGVDVGERTVFRSVDPPTVDAKLSCELVVVDEGEIVVPTCPVCVDVPTGTGWLFCGCTGPMLP